MKKITIIVIAIVILLVLLVPVPMHLKDGGTVEYKALVYKVSKVHSLATPEEMENGKEYNDGVIVEILGFEIYNNVK